MQQGDNNQGETREQKLERARQMQAENLQKVKKMQITPKQKVQADNKEANKEEQRYTDEQIAEGLYNEYSNYLRIQVLNPHSLIETRRDARFYSGIKNKFKHYDDSIVLEVRCLEKFIWTYNDQDEKFVKSIYEKLTELDIKGGNAGVKEWIKNFLFEELRKLYNSLEFNGILVGKTTLIKERVYNDLVEKAGLKQQTKKQQEKTFNIR